MVYALCFHEYGSFLWKLLCNLFYSHHNRMVPCCEPAFCAIFTLALMSTVGRGTLESQQSGGSVVLALGNCQCGDASLSRRAYGVYNRSIFVCIAETPVCNIPAFNCTESLVCACCVFICKWNEKESQNGTSWRVFLLVLQHRYWLPNCFVPALANVGSLHSVSVFVVGARASRVNVNIECSKWFSLLLFLTSLDAVL